MSAGWTPEARAAAADRMRARHAAHRAALAAAAAPLPAPPPPAPVALAALEPDPPGAPVSERTAWCEARDLLLAGVPVVQVARDLALPTGRVSALAFELRGTRGATPTPQRNRR